MTSLRTHKGCRRTEGQNWQLPVPGGYRQILPLPPAGLPQMPAGPVPPPLPPHPPAAAEVPHSRPVPAVLPLPPVWPQLPFSPPRALFSLLLPPLSLPGGALLQRPAWLLPAPWIPLPDIPARRRHSPMIYSPCLPAYRP